MTSIKPYKISIPDSSLSQLKSKLSATAFPASVDFSDSWDYGTPLSDIKRLATYWRDSFDWRAQEKYLNDKLPQYTTTVEVEGFGALNIHFVYQKGNGKKNIPLLFCHGWPGSFLEVMKILPLLTQGNGDGVSFDVVAPSLPNFGFSEGVKKGFGTPQYAEAIHKVMLNLGYEKYGECEIYPCESDLVTRHSHTGWRLGLPHYAADRRHVSRLLSRISHQFHSHQQRRSQAIHRRT
jgi:hypothetical protein